MFMKRQGIVCSSNCNPCDYYLRALSIDPQHPDNSETIIEVNKCLISIEIIKLVIFFQN